MIKKIQAMVYNYHPFILLLSCVLCIIGSLAVYLFHGVTLGAGPPLTSETPGVKQAVFIGASICIYVLWFFYLEDRFDLFKAGIETEKARKLDNEYRLTQSRIKLLEAQIEPHFIFNTLTSIVSLEESDARKAGRMELNFIRYLKAALSKTRTGETTISKEKDLLYNYLEIFKIRMDDRLHYTIRVEPGIEQLKMPPMLIQPIVENALKHGLEPKIEGGIVQISARQKEKLICWEIFDTGLGFSEKSTAGTGLSNIRERLAHLYGNRASFIIRENSPCGTIITMEVPYV